MMKGPIRFISTAIKKSEFSLKNFLSNNLPINVSSKMGSQKITIKDLVEKAKLENRPLVFTFTPGPFKDAKELPKSWTAVPDAVGCTLQLNTFNKHFENLAGSVFALNKHTHDYQCGHDGLLAVKNLDNLMMLSITDDLESNLKLDTILVDDKKYLSRFTIAVKSTGEAQSFPLQGPVNDEKIKKHIEEINCFIMPKLIDEERAEMAELKL